MVSLRQSVRTNNDVEGNNLYTSLICNDHNLFKAYVLKKTTLQQTYVYWTRCKIYADHKMLVEKIVNDA
jgi:hypothetical protein